MGSVGSSRSGVPEKDHELKKNGSIILLSMTGLATAASAQNFSLTLVPSVSTLDTFGGGLFTIDVYADADVGSHIAECAFGLQSDSFGVSGITWTPAEWAEFNIDDGYAGNGNHNTVNFGQIIIPGIRPPSTGSWLGQRVGSFVISTIEFNGVLEFELVERDTLSLRVYDETQGVFYQNNASNLYLQGFSINAVIPAPSGASVILVSGLLCSRRNR